MRGGVYLGNSIWKGAPGQMVRVLSNIKLGHCFAGDTKLQMNDGSVKHMIDLRIGDVLIGSTTVVATMTILNVYNEPYYRVSGGVDNEPIYVSGTHYIYNSDLRQYNIVEELKDAERSDRVESTMYCVITSNNLIPVGSHIFWDWEDYKINLLAR